MYESAGALASSGCSSSGQRVSGERSRRERRGHHVIVLHGDHIRLTMRATETARRDTAAWVERGLTILAALWLQIVGVVTSSVLHHILHAAPIAILAILPRSRWVRHTAALTGFLWVFMLSAISPMISHMLHRGVVFGEPGLAYTWLAPTMLVISAAWSAVNIAILAGMPRGWPLFALGQLVLGVMLALGQPWVAPLYEVPLERLLVGNLAWAAVLAAEVPLTLVVPWWLVRLLTRQREPALTGKNALWQAVYWVGFAACMVLGLLPQLN